MKAKPSNACRILSAACLSAALLCLPACQRDFSTPDDLLRRDKIELQNALEDAEERIETLTAELAEARAAAVPPAVEGANPPALSRIAFDSYSAAIDEDADGTDDAVRVYVRTYDQLDRFLPVSAEATLQVVVIRPGQEPVTLAEVDYDPEAFDAAYRSGITGTHYTLEAELTAFTADDAEAIMQVTVTDAVTGLVHTAQMPTSLRISP